MLLWNNIFHLALGNQRAVISKYANNAEIRG